MINNAIGDVPAEKAKEEEEGKYIYKSALRLFVVLGGVHACLCVLWCMYA